MPEVVIRVVRVMPHLFKHPKSGMFYFRRVVPPDLRERLGQREIRISLHTKDRSEAKRLLPETEVAVDAKFSAAREGPISLSYQQVVALAGSWYERELTRREPNPGPEEQLDIEFDSLDFARDGSIWEKREAARADAEELLAREELVVDDHSVRELELQLFDMKVRLVLTLLQRVKGDYRPDPIFDHLPRWRPVRITHSDGDRTTITGLVEVWAAERRPSDRTPYEWARVVNRLAGHVRHDELSKLTPRDIVS